MLARRSAVLVVLLIMVTLLGCASGPVDREARETPCAPPPIVVPTMPVPALEYLDLDPATGLHVTGTAQEIDVASYRLVVTGTVDHPLSLTYDDLRCMPKVEATCTLVCPGFFEDEATWAGVPLAHVLELAGVSPEPIGLRLVGADGYDALATMDMAVSQGAFLAYEWDTDKQGFPWELNPAFVDLVSQRFTRGDTILLSCRSGGRAALAIDALAEVGFTRIYNILDGMEGSKVGDPDSVFHGMRLKNGWKASGMPWTYDLDPAQMELPARPTGTLHPGNAED